MMRRVWLAAILGILMGVGLAIARTAPLDLTAKGALPEAYREQPTQLASTVRPSSPGLQMLILALLVGVVVAAPVFLVARRRSR